jgi:hypothetical protein
MPPHRLSICMLVSCALAHGSLAEGRPFADPVAVYRFSGNANDSTPNGLHGVVTAATLTNDRFGRADSAYSFDGASSRIDCGTPAAFNFDSSQFSISVWFKRSPASASGTLVGRDKSGDAYHQFRLSISSGELVFMASDSARNTGWSAGSGYALMSQSEVTTGCWHQAVITRADRTFSLYLDGVLQATVTTDSVVDFSSNPYSLLIGAVHYGDTGVNSVFVGNLDDVRIYRARLSSGEIGTLYTEGQRLISLRYHSMPDYYVRCQDTLAELTTVQTPADTADAIFRVVPGLVGDSSASFELVSRPGIYLSTAEGVRAKFVRVDTSAVSRSSASFRIVPGLADPSCVSLRSYYHLPNSAYLCYQDSHLWVDYDGPGALDEASTFEICEGGVGNCGANAVEHGGKSLRPFAASSRATGPSGTYTILGRITSASAGSHAAGLLLGPATQETGKVVRTKRY